MSRKADIVGREGSMKLYFLDSPIDDEAVSMLNRVIVRNDLETGEHGIVQCRLPYVKPVADDEGRYSLRLRDYVRIFFRHYARVGLHARRDEILALLLPQHSSLMSAAAALALSEICGRAPRIVVRGAGRGSAPRLVDTGKLLACLAQRADIAFRPSA
ncbi:MAG TPA: hypothetical protein VFA95_05910 [Gammaproteobacteria bacterium]|nr:hypothetical protein [Gammaproteobacteria bacterium]